jgi:serine/threonine protein kinase
LTGLFIDPFRYDANISRRRDRVLPLLLVQFPNMTATLIRAKFDILQHTLFSVIYTEKGNVTTVLKAGAIWIDGQPHGWRPCTKNTAADLKREARIYEALGDHPRITKFINLEVGQPEQVPWALRLERAPYGSLRQYIKNNSPPTMSDRLRLAIEFAEGVQYLHERSVLWGDLSVRNALVFNDLELKLCDFAGSRLDGVFDEITFGYELRYRPPIKEAECPKMGSLELEIFALGSAIYEITEWQVPYSAAIDDMAVDKALGRGEWPLLSEKNPAGFIIQECWNFESEAQKAAENLRLVARSSS